MKKKITVATDNIKLTPGGQEYYATELVIANKELALQVIEREKRAAELLIANKELAFQNTEKENRAAELAIANIELALQITEKEKRASELIIANKELAFQNAEKEKRAAELVIANKELAYQNQEKENRAAELIIANKELAFQNEEKEKRATELLIANRKLESFTFISSHHLQEPLRKIQAFSGRILDEEYDNLSEKGKYYFERTKLSALHMQKLINDLLAYSRTSDTKKQFEKCDLKVIVSEVMTVLKDEVLKKDATIEAQELGEINVIPLQFKQLLQNLIDNSLRFCEPEIKPHIIIKSNFIKYNTLSDQKFTLKEDHHHIRITDNGIGFEPEYNYKVFEIFQRLNVKSDHENTGIGLTIARKIVENHNGIITANGQLNIGTTFDIYIPAEQ